MRGAWLSHSSIAFKPSLLYIFTCNTQGCILADIRTFISLGLIMPKLTMKQIAAGQFIDLNRKPIKTGGELYVQT